MHIATTLRFIISNFFRSPFILPQYQKVLILGSGPSLDCIKSLKLENYDAIIAINHAVLCDDLANFYNKVYWFSGDHGRLEELCNVVARKPLRKRLYACYYPHKYKRVLQICSDSKIDIQKVILPILSYLKMFIYSESPPYHKRSLKLHQSIRLYLEDDEMGLPAIGDSSLLSALLLASKSCKNIDLLGCDLSDGRSSHTNIVCAGKSNLSTTNANRRYLDLVKSLNLYGVNISNLSWQDLSTI